jgi:phenylacetate-CoA ligase
MSAISDSIQDLVQSNPRRADWVQRRMPEALAWRLGRRKALSIFRSASSEVAAYRAVLKENTVDPRTIRDFESFQTLPIIDKQSYLMPNRHRLEDLCLGGDVTRFYAIGRSSGYSGEPLYWPRIIAQENVITNGFEMLIGVLHHASEMSTLVVICFDLGMWVGGEIAAHAARQIAKMSRYSMTVVTPGSDIEETLAVIRDLGPKYEQTLIAGYPPFLRQVIERGEDAGIDWPALNVSLQCGGEGYSEEWRSAMLERLGKADDLTAVLGGFGSTEGMLLGLEQPLTIVARRLANADAELRRDLYGSDVNSYSMVQYNPAGTYVEIIDGEMVMTAAGAVPLVRFNMHDLGGIIGFDRFTTILADHGYGPKRLEAEGVDLSRMWRNPLLYSLGRKDSVSVDGANIYAEALAPALLFPGMEGINNYKLSVQERHGQLQFVVLVERASGVAGDKTPAEAHSRAARYQQVFVERLLDVNPDFRSAHRNNPASLMPEVRVYAYGEGPFEGDAARVKQQHVWVGEL